MTAAVRQGVILAAGRGTRLRPFSLDCPKPLQPICNKPIMQYQMEAMREAGIRDIAIVIGTQGQQISNRFGDGSTLGLHLTYIEDPAPAGIAASLACAETWVRGPFAVFLGDIFLALDDLGPALAPLAAGAGGIIIVRPDTPAAVRRNFAVLTDPDGRVNRVIEKPATPPTTLKGCGVYAFDGTVFDAIRRTPRSTLRNEYEITDALQVLIDMGRPVYAAAIVRWDVNVTFPEDLLACNLRLLREQQHASLVGIGAHVGPNVHLQTSIIGDRAVVDAPVLLDECLVLPDTQVRDFAGSIRRHIFADGVTWDVERGC